MKNKKAAIQISMSWIFMALVGTMFILVAYNIIDNYRSVEEDKYQIELKNSLRSILNNVGRTAGIESNSLEPLGNIFRDMDVEILCEGDFPILSLNGKLDANNQYLQNYPTFMTYISQGKVDQTYLAVESLKIPFKTTNMLALVSKKNLIIFDSNSDISEDLVYKFKKTSYSDLNYQTMDISTLNNQFIKDVQSDNINSVVFVSDSDINLNLDLNNFKIEATHVKINKINDIVGNITIKDKKNEETFQYIDFDKSLGLITMASFSSLDTFKCSYNQIIKNTISQFEFYKFKTEQLIELSKTNKICSSSFSSLDEQKFKYEEFLSTLNSGLEEIKNNKFKNIEEVGNRIREIDFKLKELEAFNCIYVY